MLALRLRWCVGKPVATRLWANVSMARDVNPLAVQIRAFSARRREHFVADGIEHDARDRLAVLGEADRDGEAGIAVREVRGAVERIHVPAVFRARRSRPAAFFGDNRVIGKMFSRSRATIKRFGTAIRFRDDIHFTFVGNLFRAVELARRIAPASRAVSMATSRNWLMRL